jgi:hypothetical protein
MDLDPIYIVNLVLCIIILILGYLTYRKSKEFMPIYIGIGFTLFGISHLATILGLKEMLSDVLIVIRTLGYLLVIFALYMFWKRKK